MTESRSIPVRFSDEMIKEMDVASKELHLQNRTDLIKVSVRSLLDYIEQYGPDEMRVDFGKIFSALIAEMDGRTGKAEDEKRKSKATERGSK